MSDCIFCRIASGEQPAEKLMDEEDIVAFRDINPKAPTHILVVPRQHIPTLLDVGPEQTELLGKLHRAAVDLARREGLDDKGFRLVTNCLQGAGQSVFHLHLHLLGGRRLGWPPG